MNAAPVDRATAETFLEIDPEAFARHFDRKPFVIGHHLVDHPLFSLPRLLELSQKLPESCIEYNAGNVPVNLNPQQTPRTGLSIEESIRRIEECQSWMVLKNVEQDEEYRDLLHQCLEEISPHSDPLHPGMTKREGFIFVTSANSVTPYHVDPEHNFLLQIRGSKTVHLFDGRDRSILSEEELENYYNGAHRNLVYRKEVEEKAQLFGLEPGKGLHFPVTFPHWVETSDEVSISFSITFFTPDLDQRSCVHRFNSWLRNRGLRPTPFGRSGWKDKAKYNTYRVCRRLGNLFKRD